jgi:raffinose/stachyose/melibiose transport system permease protein
MSTPTHLEPVPLGRFALRALAGFALILFVVAEIYPIFWLLVSSFKAPDEFTALPIYALPRGFYFDNYVRAWNAGMATYFRNSVIATFPSVFLTVFISAAAAFGIEVLRWRFSGAVMLWILAGIMIPIQIVLLPIFAIFLHLKLLNTLYGMIILYTAFGIPLSIFLITGYLRSLPREVIEAAIVDGASIGKVFFRVVLPMMANSLLTVGLIQFFFFWNELLISLTFISSGNLRSVQSGLLSFTGEFGAIQWGPTFAGVAIAVIPTLVVYLFLNKFIVKGLTSGAVKG